MRDLNPSMLWGRIILDELAAAGLVHVCISPGSRSTPLTLAAANHPRLKVHNHIDERSAAFFALGCAKITGLPVALVCTSGSAVAHYLPALIEACHARVPLIVLGADRPVELMHTGAGQTIDQKGIFAHHVRAFEHLETPDLAPQSLRRLRTTIQRMWACSVGQPGSRAAPGPVHLNVPFREPLEPTPSQTDEIEALTARFPELVHGRPGGAWVSHAVAASEVSEGLIARLVTACTSASRGMIVCGPLEPVQHHMRDGLVELLELTGFPLMADPLSSARHGSPHPADLSAYDAFLRARDVVTGEDYAPDLIVRFGAQPTSKSYLMWRLAHPHVEEILVDAFGEAFDHPQLAAHLIYADPVQCVRALCHVLKRDCHSVEDERLSRRQAWLHRWQAVNACALTVLRRALVARDERVWEGQIASDVVTYTDEGTTLFLASSMPVRDIDAFSHPGDEIPRHMLANRGANGIDGLIATAAGVSAAQGRRCVLLIGDVAFLHDASSLLTALRDVDPTTPVRLELVVVNNAGGGIFSYLPIAAFPEHFERHFTTPHQVELEGVCRAYGATYERVATHEAWMARCERLRSSDRDQGAAYVHVTEVMVDRAHNVETHRAVWAEIVQQVNAVKLM